MVTNQSNKSIPLFFIVCVGLFVFLSLESLGLTHVIVKETVSKMETVVEQKQVITVRKERLFLIYRKTMILQWFHNLGMLIRLIFIHSYERVYFLPFWLERWQGLDYFKKLICRSLSITFFLYGEGATVYEQVIKSLDVPKRLNIIAYFSDSAEPYPINKLRNIAIDQVQTTHFWLADMDMWPACIFLCKIDC